MGKEENISYGNEYVLVVDDEEPTRELLLEMLSRLGFKVGSAESGKDALIELKGKSYTFLLTDITMPGMDGLELIRRVRKNYPHVSTIAITGYTKEYIYMDVVNAGATDFINKPFGIEELEAKVRRAIIERNIRQELSRLSITDSLTGLYNQRHFYARLKHEIMRAKRRKHGLALIFLDLDDFKQYNDDYGHLAGDEILSKVGDIINTCIREGVDSGYRYGGDEFAIILIDADASIGQNIGERIGEAIKKECNITASRGYSDFSEGMTIEAFISEADKHLYKLKGKNKNHQG